MDASRFDSLTRSVVTAGSRRRLLAGLLAGMAGLVTTRRADARRCTAPGTICREDADCCDTPCLPPNARGRRVCSACQTCLSGQICSEVLTGAFPNPTRTICCYPAGTTGVCTEDNYRDVCCATASLSVGCNPSIGQCL